MLIHFVIKLCVSGIIVFVKLFQYKWQAESRITLNLNFFSVGASVFHY